MSESVSYVKGIGPTRAALFASELKIYKIEQFFTLLPIRYIDKTKFYKVKELQQNSAEVQIIGKIAPLQTVKQKRGSRLVATFFDETGKIELVWFRGEKWVRESLKLNVPVVVFGKVNYFNGFYNMPHPDVTLLSEYERKNKTQIQLI